MISNAALSEMIDIVDPQSDDHQQPPKSTSSNTLINIKNESALEDIYGGMFTDVEATFQKNQNLHQTERNRIRIKNRFKQ